MWESGDYRAFAYLALIAFFIVIFVINGVACLGLSRLLDRLMRFKSTSHDAVFVKVQPLGMGRYELYYKTISGSVITSRILSYFRKDNECFGGVCVGSNIRIYCKAQRVWSVAHYRHARKSSIIISSIMLAALIGVALAVPVFTLMSEYGLSFPQLVEFIGRIILCQYEASCNVEGMLKTFISEDCAHNAHTYCSKLGSSGAQGTSIHLP